MTQDLRGKTALVTGAGKGVGRVVARKLVEHGAHVVLNYFHSHDAALATRAELRRLGGTVHLIRASVAKPDHVDRMFDEVTAAVGGIDILVNNAASGALAPFEELEDSHWSKAFETNLRGSYLCARRAAPMMAARGGGAIVNLSSIGAGLVVDNYLTVGTSKAALESLTRYLAVEFARDNIRVNTASCGLIDGELAPLFPRAEEMRQVIVEATPLGRLASEEDLANLVLFLASDLSGWVTGQTVLADGGLCLANSILSPPSVPGRVAVEDAGGTPASRPAESETDPVAATAADQDTEGHPDTIVVVGMGVVVPGAGNPAEFWELRTRGEAVFGEPGDRWDLDGFYAPDQAAEDRTYSRSGGYITDPAQFSGDRSDEYTTRWLRTALRQALDGVTTRDGDRWTWAVGYTADGSQHLEEALVAHGLRDRMAALVPEPQRTRFAAEFDEFVRAATPRAGERPSEYLPHIVGQRAMEGLLPAGTEPLMIDTACSSSLYSIDAGIKDLLSGTTDIAACGGAFGLGPRGSTLFSKLKGLSKSGTVRCLDKANDGVLFSDGAGVVILKTLRRAREDGDRVLGVLAGLGTSSDGRGKAIYAPNAAGQQLAISRALRSAGVSAEDIDWVVAHATGTPAGDLAEFESLRRSLRSTRPIAVTSNKSLIGHTGWAAGVVSLIEVLLAFEHGRIPAQSQYTEAPADFRLAETNLTIPTTSRSWPRTDRARTAAVSGFGFGGTNAHLIVRDRPDRAEKSRGPVTERLAIVGWSTALPGAPGRDEVAQWLRGTAPPPGAGYGDSYPLPPFSEVRIPPATLRTIDRAQLMILRCVRDLEQQLQPVWSRIGDTTGVFVGHLGPTRNSTLYAQRCYLGHLERIFRASPVLSADPEFRAAFDAFRSQVRALVPAGNENSFPGVMPNVIPARVANYFDFHGPNIAVDTGFTAGLSAVGVAARYLRWGEVDLALTCGINGNSSTGLHRILGRAVPSDGEIAEGAFMVALMLESNAEKFGLPVLGSLDTPAPGQAGPGAEITIDPSRAARSYLAGDGVKALIEAIVRPEPAVRVSCTDPLSGSSAQLVVRTDTGEQPAAAFDPEARRHTIRLLPYAYEQVRAPIPAISAGTLIVTHDLGIGRRLADRGAMVLCTERADRAHPEAGIHLPDTVDETIFDDLPAGWLERVRHLRVVAALGDPAGGATEEMLRLHDATFLALQRVHAGQRLRSFTTLLLSAVPGGVPHPVSGMFTGLVKSAALELESVQCFVVLSSSAVLDVGFAQLERESAADRLLPVVVYDGEQRKTYIPVPEPAGPATTALSRSSVIVAVGGGRGITAQCLVAAAASSAAKIWVLGSNPLDAYPADIYTGSAAEFTRRRAEFISSGRAGDPAVSVAELNRRFERMVQARTVRSNLARMAEHSGADRVRYLTCDIRDAAAVAEAVRTIVDTDGRIDLLIHAAGLNRGAALGRKDFREFQLIRDLKVRGHDNLRRAFAGAAELTRPAIWCNFGSLVGVVGQQGEADYAAGNDYLTTAAAYGHTRYGGDEFTINWTLWGEVGLGSDPVTKAFMQRSGLYTVMSTDEGIGHFLGEIAQAQRFPAVVHIGDTERRAIDARIPGLLGAGESPERSPHRDFFLGSVLVEEPSRMVWERNLDLRTDSYLVDHLVNGVPTLPGTLVTAIVAEAALAMVPGRRVTAISDLSFRTFLRAYPGRAGTVFRIAAELRDGRHGEQAVSVRVLSDVHAPDGTLLQRDRLHFQATVHLREELPPAPRRPQPTTAAGVPALDPYHISNRAVHLTGCFVSTRDTRIGPDGAQGVFALPPERRHPAFGNFPVPAVLLDGLARLAVLTSDRYVPLAAPLSVGRIEFFDERNDTALADAFPEGVTLYSTPGNSLEAEAGVDELGAVTADGRLLLRMSQLRGLVFGYVDTREGEFLTVEQFSRRRGDRADVAAEFATPRA